MSYSMLKNLNLPQGIAADRGEYVEKAVALGLDHEQRRELRQYLLQSALERSAIWDARGIAGDLEQALLAMGRAGRPGAAS
jgi:predicted O-linked N-acetylglucosamine transferase (SPINDLY family)